MFSLHPQLEKDTLLLGHFSLSLVLLHRDSNFPWCILVPEREAIQEIYHLGLEDRQQLMKESCHLAEVMADMFVPDKMNIAAIGNKVSQLHLHHVARFKTDAAWPGAVWGAEMDPRHYENDQLDALAMRLRGALAGENFRSA